MPTKDLHEKPFDEVTLTKLEIFEDYAEAWIPTFVMQRSKEIHIFDLFAGTGYDKERKPGSPIRLLQKIKAHQKNIIANGVNIKIHLNEYKKNKQEILQNHCEEFLEQNSSLKKSIELKYYNLEFSDCFEQVYPSIKNYPSLVYLDQNGIKYFELDFIKKLEDSGQTDFLYFVSSSYFWRFGETEEFQSHLPVDLEEIKKNPYKYIHKTLLEELKKKLSAKTKLMLYPFTLKKGKNIYGIIFGASHPRAVDKFLKIVWNKDKISGEANFDIYDDMEKEEQPQLLGLSNPLKSKKEIFSMGLEEKILKEEIKNNEEAYNYSIKQGHLGQHAAEVIKEMKKKGKIFYEGTSPLVTYENVYKEIKLITYKVNKK